MAAKPPGREPGRRYKKSKGDFQPFRVAAVRLSPRERQVLALLLGGNSPKKVARQLNLSEHTVGDYLKTLYKRFAVSSRAELLARFIPSKYKRM